MSNAVTSAANSIIQTSIICDYAGNMIVNSSGCVQSVTGNVLTSNPTCGSKESTISLFRTTSTGRSISRIEWQLYTKEAQHPLQ